MCSCRRSPRYAVDVHPRTSLDQHNFNFTLQSPSGSTSSEETNVSKIWYCCKASHDIIVRAEKESESATAVRGIAGLHVTGVVEGSWEYVALVRSEINTGIYRLIYFFTWLTVMVILFVKRYSHTPTCKRCCFTSQDYSYRLQCISYYNTVQMHCL